MPDVGGEAQGSHPEAGDSFEVRETRPPWTWWLSRHLYCRMLDNGQVETQQIKDIQEDIDNYIENSQEPDFYENEYIYDDISGLDAMLLDVSCY